MNETLFFGFLAATALLLSAPGPSCALAASQAIRHGPRAAALTVAGDALGSTVHIIIATLGLQILIGIAGFVLPFVQIIGGIYVAYLGIKSWRDTRDQNNTAANPDDQQAFFIGFVTCLSNPKAVIFFIALFPGFIDPSYNIPLQSFVYGIVFIVLDALSIMLYAILGLTIARSRLFSSVRHSLFSATGLFLVGAFLIVKGSLEVIELVR
ncbi:LysE family translocator [Salinarimonas ramus]|uniref:Flagellar biosynthesis protein FlgM n=1 Tax=Salinarimonas ramus TaxID=690164 RepID=A0A917V3R0_9HYPH|nr:LysE family translocator [Salinarimonas ramus]GGK32130.1 flagellar biosynthesis protein FlgM [Salinarimonas ramus]